MGNTEATRKCLRALQNESKNEDDQHMAIYLLAYEDAKSGDHEAAIRTIQSLPADSRWSVERHKLISQWTKKMKWTEKQAKEQAKKEQQTQPQPK
jgi:predicted ATP-grasp superfamily ATP-dependent carboligase